MEERASKWDFQTGLSISNIISYNTTSDNSYKIQTARLSATLLYNIFKRFVILFSLRLTNLIVGEYIQ